MSHSYLDIQRQYLQQAWLRPIDELEKALPATLVGESFHFHAFGEPCVFSPSDITLSGIQQTGPEGILIALYANHAQDKPLQMNPLKSFKELPDTMPYQAAFAHNAEQILVPHVPFIRSQQEDILARFSGRVNPYAASGDFSFTLYPLPRIPLYYVFYLPDDEFPASVSCLFAANINDFMPVAGLADVAECTARRIISLAAGES